MFPSEVKLEFVVGIKKDTEYFVISDKNPDTNDKSKNLQVAKC